MRARQWTSGKVQAERSGAECPLIRASDARGVSVLWRQIRRLEAAGVVVAAANDHDDVVARHGASGVKVDR